MRQLFCEVLFFIFVTLSACLVRDISENFYRKVAEKEFTLVKFYAEWCVHCKNLAPIYEEAAKILEEESDVAAVEVKCNKEPGAGVCKQEKVDAYPTVKLFRDGANPIESPPIKSVDDILGFVRKAKGTHVVKLNTLSELNDLVQNSNVYTVVGFFSSEDLPIARAFLDAAKDCNVAVKFAQTFDAALLKDVEYVDQIVIYQPKNLQNPALESIVRVYEGPSVTADILDFITHKRHGYCGIRTSANAFEFENPLVVAYFHIDFERNRKVAHYVRNRMMRVAKATEDAFPDLHFAISDVKSFSNELALLGLHIDESDVMTVKVIGTDANGKRYIMKDDFSENALETFVKAMMSGDLQPFIRSEPETISEEDGVKVLVGSNFESIVSKAEEDYFIEMYAPWCGHCKKLAPEYAALAAALKNSPNIVIAKINADDNELPPQFQITGFPTLFFVPQGKFKHPIRYEGARNVKSFIEFLAPRTTKPLVGYDRTGKSIPKEEL